MNMGNLFLRAAKLVGTQTIQWYAQTSRTLTTAGYYVSAYAAPVPVQASVQPMPRTLVQQAGLDLQKDYVMIYSAQNMNDVARDMSGDRFVFGNFTYQLLSNTEWFPINGWNGSIAVNIKPANQAP